METRRLRRYERLRRKRDFDRVFREGRSVVEEILRVVYVENDLGIRRIGVVVRKRLGKAHVRNRLKRLVREVYRNNKEIFPDSVDMVFLFRNEAVGTAKGLSYKDMESIMKKLAERMK